MATMLVRNAELLVTMDAQRRELTNAGLFIRDGFIEQVGPTDGLPTTADRVLDLRGQIVLPGLVNCHHHLDQILTRNIPAGQNINLFPWLRAHYRLWAARTPASARPATMRGNAQRCVNASRFASIVSRIGALARSSIPVKSTAS